jgi:hypothetical protein
MPRDFNVGDRESLRNGLVIECIEVYYEGRRRTGKWVEIGYIVPASHTDGSEK